MCFNPKESLGHYCVQPIRHGLNWWFWCGHEAFSTLPFCCTRPHSTFKTLTSFLGVLTAFGISCAFWRDLGGTFGCPRNFGWHPRMSAKSAGVCEICERALRLRNGVLDGFRRIFVDSDGVRRILAGFCGAPRFSGGCVRMLAQFL